jgi:glycosyltransferase involved in cell wall biosynthesis
MVELLRQLIKNHKPKSQATIEVYSDMKVLFITNIPSPYRVDFFNELGKYCELTVCYERHTAADRNSLWKGKATLNYREVYANVKPIGIDKSCGFGVIDVIKSEKFDKLIITGYASPAIMIAITYCRLNRISYYIESDGAFFTKDKFLKRMVKKYLLCGASLHLTTCDEHIKYLRWLGIHEEKIHKYPFSSVTDADMKATTVLNKDEKVKIREKLGMKETNVILSVGRFSYDGGYGKGYDTLLKAVRDMSDVGVYIVGDEPTEEFIRMKNEMGVHHVHFIGFKTKGDLQDYYAAADIFVLLTRSDVWGLVINEAMMHGLPVITTTRCNAGLEMVKDGENGFLVAPEDFESVRKKLYVLLNSFEDLSSFSKSSRNIAEKYTIEHMVRVHLDILQVNNKI